MYYMTDLVGAHFADMEAIAALFFLLKEEVINMVGQYPCVLCF